MAQAAGALGRSSIKQSHNYYSTASCSTEPQIRLKSRSEIGVIGLFSMPEAWVCRSAYFYGRPGQIEYCLEGSCLCDQRIPRLARSMFTQLGQGQGSRWRRHSCLETLHSEGAAGSCDTRQQRCHKIKNAAPRAPTL